VACTRVDFHHIEVMAVREVLGLSAGPRSFHRGGREDVIIIKYKEKVFSCLYQYVASFNSVCCIAQCLT
jgi:hypothetical protein